MVYHSYNGFQRIAVKKNTTDLRVSGIRRMASFYKSPLRNGLNKRLYCIRCVWNNREIFKTVFESKGITSHPVTLDIWKRSSICRSLRAPTIRIPKAIAW